MKQINTLLLLLALAIILTACGGADAPAEPAADEPVITQQESDEIAPPPTPLPPPVINDSSTTASPAPPTLAPEPAAPEAAAPAFVRPWPASDFGYGIQVHGNASVGDPAQTMASVRDQLGLDWVKMQVQWWLVHPDPTAEQWFFYDSVIEEAHKNGLNLMVSIVGAPAWTRAAGGENGPPDDYNLYAQFLVEMLQRHPGQIDAIEVWNEQNLDREWTTSNGISPEDYVEFLRVSYEAVKAEDPDVIIISGALSPTGDGDWVRWAHDFDYMDRALAAGMLNYADCVGAHHNGYNLPADVPVEDANSHPKAATAVFRGPFDNQYTGNRLNHLWTFKSTIDGYIERVQAVNPEMKLCVTEFGWATSEGYDQAPAGFEFALDNSLQDQADYIVQAFQTMHDSGKVWLAFLFNYDFGNKGGGPTDDPVPYSIIDTNGVPRAAFGAIANMEKPR
ncbi:MAG: hypothetical protein KC419_11995 [Anaerolineales bacterium]|nr:hypothetical protein [Anaerolineales bacterium]MCA9929199.1 hypothetical protein [Anaerolineales bacterium]